MSFCASKIWMRTGAVRNTRAQSSKTFSGLVSCGMESRSIRARGGSFTLMPGGGFAMEAGSIPASARAKMSPPRRLHRTRRSPSSRPNGAATPRSRLPSSLRMASTGGSGFPTAGGSPFKTQTSAQSKRPRCRISATSSFGTATTSRPTNSPPPWMTPASPRSSGEPISSRQLSANFCSTRLSGKLLRAGSTARSCATLRASASQSGRPVSVSANSARPADRPMKSTISRDQCVPARQSDSGQWWECSRRTRAPAGTPRSGFRQRFIFLDECLPGLFVIRLVALVLEIGHLFAVEHDAFDAGH